MQHGVVARRQLVGQGLGARALEHRLACGRLHPIHRGVYAVGHTVLSRHGRWMAAVLFAGEGAALSHRSAAVLWGLRRWASTRIEVVSPRRVSHDAGVHMHCSKLPADEITSHAGIQVTTVARTLLDLAAVVPLRQLERAVQEAEVLRLDERLALADLIRRYPGRRGIRAARWAVAQVGASTRTRSELEERFLALVDRAGLERPEVNVWLEAGGRHFEIDCLWRRRALAVELDGRAFHDTESAFDRDRSRDRALTAAGWTVVRLTWRQVVGEPRSVLRDLRTLLAA